MAWGYYIDLGRLWFFCFTDVFGGGCVRLGSLGKFVCCSGVVLGGKLGFY